MAIKTVNGVAYFNIPDAAKYLGISTVSLGKSAILEGLAFVNFKENGTLYVTVESIKSFQQREALKKANKL